MSVIHELEVGLFHVHVSRCTSFAGVTLLMYDHLLTFSDEVRFIWTRPRNPISIMFLINRYSTPLILAVDIYDKGGLNMNLNNQFCKVWFVTEGYLNFLILAIVHCMMVLRVSALYGNRRGISILLYTAYALYFLSTVSILSPGMFEADKSIYGENLLLHACWGKIVNYFWAIWVPALILETLLFCLTAWKAWQHSRDNMNVPVARTLYRDGFQYFIVIVLCTLFPLLVWSTAPSTLDALPKYVTMGVVNVMSSRLVLNLRRHTSSGTNTTTFDAYEMSNNPSARSARSATTIWGGPDRRARKAGLESELDVYLDTVKEYQPGEEVRLERLEQSTDQFPPRHRSFEFDLELAGVDRIGRPTHETGSMSPSELSRLPPRT